MGPAIALRLRQHLTLTPQVQQALRLLQMSALEFAQEMDQALSSNPFLEENADAQSGDAQPATPRESSASSIEEVVVPQEAPASGGFERDHEEWSGASDAQPTLREHLREQLMISPMGSRDRALAHMVIDSLDDDGYFKLSFEELAALVPPEHDVRPEDFLAALRLVQSLDPAGVAARTLEECLELQLLAVDQDTPGRACALDIVRGRHLQLLGNREWARLQHAVACDEHTLHTARALIRTLDPKPGHRFGAPEARYVVPDVVVRKVRERWVASINPASLPRVRLNRAYAEALQGRGSSQSLSRQLQEARWLLRSIEQRFATIQRVADAIVTRQRGFFEYGEVAMKPLTLKLIAGELGLHESTVCRVTNNKYMATPRGLFEFKHFFSRRLATESGGAASATAVRAVMKELIAAEDPRAPLSDAELARLLAQQGLRVARRTITKYRALMRLPSVDVRRADMRR
ncbi:MAG TPA: RNA polymerase factor sigma-54 [Burkholderiales bacterium]|jgi:RNA polymerase sigma-54 factor